jgi:Na+/H+ antiporter NhaD/arsenite permease-like protein
LTDFLTSLRQYIPALFALMVAAAGWFYLFYSRAAHRLSGVEDPRLNLRRIRLRRVGGVAMILLGILFYAGFYTVDQQAPTLAFLLVWLAVLLLMAMILFLAIIDMRLTFQIRRDRHRRDGDE